MVKCEKEVLVKCEKEVLVKCEKEVLVKCEKDDFTILQNSKKSFMGGFLKRSDRDFPKTSKNPNFPIFSQFQSNETSC